MLIIERMIYDHVYKKQVVKRYQQCMQNNRMITKNLVKGQTVDNRNVFVYLHVLFVCLHVYEGQRTTAWSWFSPSIFK